MGPSRRVTVQVSAGGAKGTTAQTSLGWVVQPGAHRYEFEYSNSILMPLVFIFSILSVHGMLYSTVLVSSFGPRFSFVMMSSNCARAAVTSILYSTVQYCSAYLYEYC